jgi:hypothetical protein
MSPERNRRRKITVKSEEENFMTIRKAGLKMGGALLALIVFLSPGAFSQDTGDGKKFKQEELDQMLAPVALYPDTLLSQILMASTYPLEVVEAARWAKDNRDLKGDELAKALESQPWDPSVKSLVNFPQVLDMMDSKLDWTQKLGDAFLAQQKDVMGTVQNLRQKASGTGNLNTTSEQKVTGDPETKTYIIESASPDVIYVPVYDPAVVYGPWWYPAYPPYAYYPPGYVPGTAFSFAAGVAIGAAWGYAWGEFNWHNGEVNVNVNKNINVNNNYINRDKYAQQIKDKGNTWRHDPDHRGGVAYRDQATASRFQNASAMQADRSREAFRENAATSREGFDRAGSGELREGRSGDLGGDRSGEFRRSSSGASRGGGRERSGARGRR